MTLRTGLRTSSNRAAVRLLQEIGIPRAVQYAQTMGVGDVPGVPSLALGSGEVTLETMTAAYAAFANKGKVPTPISIRRVEARDGTLLYEAQEVSRPAIDETTAFLMTNMLADVVNAGTAAGVRSLGFSLPAAGKTGTTNDFNDAWFVGFTPRLVTGVWVGFDQPQTILPNGFAADIAVPFWAKFMKAATRGDKPEWFRPPRGVSSATVCRVSGLLASEGCRHVEVVGREGYVETRTMAYTEYFVHGTEPTEYCDLHERRGFFGTLAGVFTDKPDEPRAAESTRPASVRGGELAAQAESARPADTPTAAAAEPAPLEIAPPAPEKKRGFWSRLFGRRNNDKDETK
jgi:penicillin-binding protein 1A